MTWAELITKQNRTKSKRFSNFLKLGLNCDREVLYRRINQRTAAMLHQGLRGEVENLLSLGYTRELKSMQSIGYRHMIEHLLDRRTMAETEQLLARDTRRYAKRQFTWFRKMEIEWFDIAGKDHLFKEVDSFLRKK